MEKELLATIMKNTYTTDELHHRLAVLRDYLESVHFAGTEVQNTNLETFVSVRKIDNETAQALRAWGDAFYASFTAENVYELLEAIQRASEALPVVTTYVPVVFSGKEILRIGEWFRKNVQGRILLSFKLDPSVVGGCGIVWGSTYYDYSFAHFARERHGELIALLQSHEHSA